MQKSKTCRIVLFCCSLVMLLFRPLHKRSSIRGLIVRSRQHRTFRVQGNCSKPVKESALLRTLHGAIGSSASPGRQATSEPRKRLAPQKKLHILVAEDNLVNQAVARALLTKWGHTLHIAPNGLEAVALFKKQRFDICLMDVSADTPGCLLRRTTAPYQMQASALPERRGVVGEARDFQARN